MSERNGPVTAVSQEPPASASRPSSPNRTTRQTQSRPVLFTPSFRPPAAAHAQHPKQPAQTLQQFYDWFVPIDRSVACSQEVQVHFRLHLLRVVSEHLDICAKPVGRIDQVGLDKWRG